jgi:ATP-dependent DNA ligase
MLLAASSSFIEPCLPSAADRPPSGSNWIHEIKHDGYRLMARRDPVGIHLITRRNNDWSARFPLVIEAVSHLKVRSCLIRGKVRSGQSPDWLCSRTWRRSCVRRGRGLGQSGSGR